MDIIENYLEMKKELGNNIFLLKKALIKPSVKQQEVLNIDYKNPKTFYNGFCGVRQTGKTTAALMKAMQAVNNHKHVCYVTNNRHVNYYFIDKLADLMNRCKIGKHTIKKGFVGITVDGKYNITTLTDMHDCRGRINRDTLFIYDNQALNINSATFNTPIFKNYLTPLLLRSDLHNNVLLLL